MGTFGVAVKAAIVRDQRLLVLYKSDFGVVGDPNPSHRRDLPGGRLRLGESPLQGLRREVIEETGLSVHVVCPAHVWHHFDPMASFQLVGITFLREFVSGEVQLSDEHTHYEWLTHDDILPRGWSDAEDYLAILRLAQQRPFNGPQRVEQ